MNLLSIILEKNNFNYVFFTYRRLCSQSKCFYYLNSDGLGSGLHTTIHQFLLGLSLIY